MQFSLLMECEYGTNWENSGDVEIFVRNKCDVVLAFLQHDLTR